MLDSCIKKTKPTVWRAGAKILKKEEEDVRLLDRCEAKRKERAKHWQCDESVQNMEDKPWTNEELKKLEEALPRLEECDLEKASRLLQGKDRSGMRGKKREEKSCSSWRRWSRVAPQQACTTKFFLMPENVTSERSIALMPTLIRWCEALSARSGEVAAEVPC